MDKNVHALLGTYTSLKKMIQWEGCPIFKSIDILLFGALRKHALWLRRVWANHNIIQPCWKDYVTRMTNELSLYTVTVRASYLL